MKLSNYIKKFQDGSQLKKIKLLITATTIKINNKLRIRLFGSLSGIKYYIKKFL